MAYITNAELMYAMSPTTFVGIFDDDADGYVDAGSVDAVIARASALVDAWIAPVYAGPLPIVQTPIPAMIRELTLEYCLAMAYERRPDYTRNLGENNDQDRWQRADKMGERLQAAVLRIPDLQAEPKPGNVGGVVLSSGRRIIIDGPDGVRNGGDFG